MTSVAHQVTQRSLSLEATFYRTAEGYWGFAHHVPLHARGDTLQACMEALCVTLHKLLETGPRAVNRAVLHTADASIVVENPYTVPVCAVEFYNPRWLRRQSAASAAAERG